MGKSNDCNLEIDLHIYGASERASKRPFGFCIPRRREEGRARSRCPPCRAVTVCAFEGMKMEEPRDHRVSEAAKIFFLVICLAFLGRKSVLLLPVGTEWDYISPRSLSRSVGHRHMSWGLIFANASDVTRRTGFVDGGVLLIRVIPSPGLCAFSATTLP